MQHVRLSTFSAILLMVLVAQLGFAPAASAATVSVNCATGSLQNKINAASPGTIILVKGTCHGAFTTDKSLTLKGNPTATLDADQAGAVLSIQGVRVMHLRSLVLTDGHGIEGGGISMPDGGVLTLDAVTVRDNTAAADDDISTGGGIFARDAVVAIRKSSVLDNRAIALGGSLDVAQGAGIHLVRGELTISDSLIRGNGAIANSEGLADATGGAAFVIDAPLTMTASRIRGNTVTTTSGNSTTAIGGGILWQAGHDERLEITGSTFAANTATATGTGLHSALALAGALSLRSSTDATTAKITDTLFQDNEVNAEATQFAATAEAGAILAGGDHLTFSVKSTRILGSIAAANGFTTATARGGGLKLEIGTVNIGGSTVSTNTASAHSGNNTGLAVGGGIAATGTVDLRVSTTTISANDVTGVSDSSTGNGGGGGIHVGFHSNLTLRSSLVDGNEVFAQSDGGSPSAQGGGLNLVAEPASDIVVNSTLTGNAVTANGPNATSAGGAAWVENTGFLVRLSTIARNEVTATGSNTFAGGGGFYIESGTTFLHGTILAANTAPTNGPNCLGPFTSEGQNLFGDVAGCMTTFLGTDQQGAAPKLSTLADHGGPTFTLALLAGSPARNKIPVAECQSMATRDQRLVPRPQGALCDIGAFEKKT